VGALMAALTVDVVLADNSLQGSRGRWDAPGARKQGAQGPFTLSGSDLGYLLISSASDAISASTGRRCAVRFILVLAALAPQSSALWVLDFALAWPDQTFSPARIPARKRCSPLLIPVADRALVVVLFCHWPRASESASRGCHREISGSSIVPATLSFQVVDHPPRLPRTVM